MAKPSSSLRRRGIRALTAALAALAASLSPALAAETMSPAEAIVTIASRADLDRMVAAAEAVSDPAAKYEQLLSAITLYDQLSVGVPATVDGFDAPKLFELTATTILGILKNLSPDSAEFKKAIASLRVLMPRVRGDVRQLELYVQLAAIELRVDRGRALDTVIKVSTALAALPPGENRDRLRAAVVRLSTALPEIAAETVTQWTITIEHPVLRTNALRLVAMTRLADRLVNKELFRLAAIKDGRARTAALIAASEKYAGVRRFQPALFAALAIDDDFAPQRDEALTRLFHRQIEVNFRPDAIYAPYAISDARLRQGQLADLAAYSVRRGRLSLARTVADSIAAPEGAYRAWAAIAEQQRLERYVLSWAAAWDRALASALRIAASDVQGAALELLALQAASAGDEARAERLVQGLDRPDLTQAVAAALALADLDRGRVEAAEQRYRTLVDSSRRSAIAVRLYRHFAGVGNLDAANAYFPAITQPADRVRLHITEGEVVHGDPHRPTYDRARARAALSEAASELASIGPGPVRQQAAVELAAAFARLGEPEAIAQIGSRFPDLAPATKAHRLAAVARSAGLKEALAQVDGPDKPDLRARELGEIALAETERGDAPAAVDIAQRITVDRIRVRILRAIAETQARSMRADALVPEGHPTETVANAPVLSQDRFVMRPIEGDLIGNKTPEMPDFGKITGNSVRERVPAVAPGRAHVIPTGFSNFNERFSYIRYMNSVDFVGDEEKVFASGQRTLFPRFIMVESGVFDLPTLKAHLQQAGTVGDYLTSQGRIYQLNVPLLIGQGATLIVTSADVEELRLNTAASAYIVNSGRFFLVDAKLTTFDPATGQPTRRSKDEWSKFNPFYTAWSGSETYMADAWVHGLGYGNGKSYGITISSGPKNVLAATSNSLPRPKGIIADSLFTDMYYGFYSYEADDVKVVGNEYLNNEIYAIDPHDRSTNLAFAYNTTRGTREKHGIVTSRDVVDSHIVGNISLDNGGSGILLDRKSERNVIAYNLSFRNKGDGLTIYESPCNLVYRNTFGGNSREGVRVRNSFDILLSENIIERNVGSGLSVYAVNLENSTDAAPRDLAVDPYHRYADYSAARNLIGNNAEGAVRSSAASAGTLAGNRLSGEASTIVRGFKFGPAGSQILSMAKSGVAFRDACRPVRPAEACRFREEGFLGGDLLPALEAASNSVRSSCPAATLAGN